MAAVSSKRSDLKTQRKLSARSKAAKSVLNKRAVRRCRAVLSSLGELICTCQPVADDEETPGSLRIVQRANHRYAGGKPADAVLVDSALLLYTPANQWLIDDVQMFADFFEKHYPPTLQVWRQITYLRSLMDFTPSTPVLERARRTIGLTNLAAATQDARLIRESRVSYGRLLGMLQFSLTFPSKIQTASETRELVASISLLTHVSDLSNSREDRDDSWTAHMWAAQQLFTTYAPVSLPGVDRLDEGIMRHTIMNGFFLAIAKRRAWNVDTAWFHGLASKGWTTLIPAYHDLPCLLEETDKSLAGPADVSTLLSIITRLHHTRAKSANLFPEVSKPPSIDTTEIPSFDATSEEHLVMADSSAFPHLYAPLTQDGGHGAMKILLTSFLSLIVECTLLRIFHFRPDTLHTLPSSTQQEAEQAAYTLACRLCKVSLSFTQSDRIAYVSVIRFALSLARNVFEQQDRLPEMGWCDACLIANSLRMQRIRQTAAPTLCKVEDITPGFAEAGRYKARFDPKAFIVRAASVASVRLLQ